MIRSELRYHAPAGIEEACAILAASEGSGRVIGGGTMLVPLIGRGQVRADHLVHLHKASLSGIRVAGGVLELGATSTYTDLLRSPLVADSVPLLCTVAGGITGGGQIRNLGTIGGSACYANPASDVPACLVALRARLRLHSSQGVRELPADRFYTDAFTTAARSDEILGAITVPGGSFASGYYKFKLSESSWPIVTAAAVAWSEEGRRRCHVVLGAAEAIPVRVPLDTLLDDESGTVPADRIPDIVPLVEAHLRGGWDDELATGAYRHAIAATIACRAVARLNQEGPTDVAY
jgi:CO/xanthine dehydrogenase FAD-binding subunit